MAKELPYFQFEPAEYFAKDISFCSMEAQGLFINICAYYWQRECELSKSKLLKRLDHEIQFNELVDEDVIKLSGDDITISFLDDQYEKATKKSSVNSRNGSKGGRPKKDKPNQNPKETEIKAKINPNESESKGIREDKKREEEIIEDKITVKKEGAFNFRKELLNLGVEEGLIADWLKVRKVKKAVNTALALKAFLREREKDGREINEVVRDCVERSWGAFKASWVVSDVISNQPQKSSILERIETMQGAMAMNTFDEHGNLIE